MSLEPLRVNTMKLPDPAEMSVNDLRSIFLIASEEFSKRLVNSQDVGELQDLQSYLKAISQQIQRRESPNE